MAEPWPIYRNPPIVETVWSVQFAPLIWMTPAHTGIYWHSIRDRYPRCEEHPPITHKKEPENLHIPISPVRLDNRNIPLARQWFVSSDGNELVQLQADKFCVNWRRVDEDDPYPGYDHIRGLFEREWRAFETFAENEEEVGAPTVNLLELSYINHIRKNEGWKAPEQLGDIFPAASFGAEPAVLPPPDSVGARLAFDLKGPQMRLRVSCQHATARSEDQHLFRLELTVRGNVEQTDDTSVLSWFEEAHRWVIAAFTDLTNKSVQFEQWGRQS